MNSPERLSPCLVPTGSVALSVEYTLLEGVASWRRATDYYGLRWWVLKSTQNMLRGITVSPVVCISVADES